MNTEESKNTLALFTSIYQSLKLESDRGCVLVVGSLVERALEKHITERLLPKLGKEDELMGRSGNNPISSFSAKINLSYRLGIITENERSIFHQLRDLRNVCAHHIDNQDFSSQKFKDKIKNIIKESTLLWNVIHTKLSPQLFNNNPPATVELFVEAIGWREAFAIFFALIVAHKEMCIARVSRINTLYKPSV